METITEKALEAIFVSAGNVLTTIGFVPALLGIAFVPLYGGIYVWKKEIGHSKPRRAIFLVISAVISSAAIAIFWISAAVIGQWG